MAVQNGDMYTGVWYCWHWYPGKDDNIEDVTKNRMRVHQHGNDLVLESEPNDEESYMFVRLSFRDGVVTGTWQETTSPHGDFQGAVYSGAGQLIMGDDRQSMAGKWAGIGYDRKIGQPRVYTGRWALSREADAYDTV